jgi:hypothetical protein
MENKGTKIKASGWLLFAAASDCEVQTHMKKAQRGDGPVINHLVVREDKWEFIWLRPLVSGNALNIKI